MKGPITSFPDEKPIIFELDYMNDKKKVKLIVKDTN